MLHAMVWTVWWVWFGLSLVWCVVVCVVLRCGVLCCDVL